MSGGAVARYLPPLLAGALGAWTAIYAFEGPLRKLEAGAGAQGAGGGGGGGGGGGDGRGGGGRGARGTRAARLRLRLCRTGTVVKVNAVVV